MSVRVRFPSEAQGRSRTESLMVSRPAFILRPTYLQCSRLNLMAVAAVAVVNIVVVDTVVRSWLLRTWLLGHGCSVIAVATESHHTII